ncbi:hypothetical protein [Vibrio sp. 947]|uniref:hypothetical protein n=1 Tax=Vibrio sp. 947 TaxID=3074619 RepID=UPI0029647237|nr:hypothetical protein [Vibrio sp. 947]
MSTLTLVSIVKRNRTAPEQNHSMQLNDMMRFTNNTLQPKTVRLNGLKLSKPILDLLAELLSSLIAVVMN